MTKKESKKASIRQRTVMAIILLLSTAFAVTFLSILISTRSVGFMVEYYMQYIVSSFFVFALFIGVSFSVDKETKNKDLMFRNITIVIISMVLAQLVSFVLNVFIDEMALILIFPALMVSVLINRKVATYTNVLTSLSYTVLILLDSIVHNMPVSSSSLIAIILSLLSGMLMIMLVSKNYTRFRLVFGSILISILVSVLAMPASLLYTFEFREVMFNSIWLFAGQIISIAMFTLLLPLYERVFEVCSDFKLAELASFSQPLLLRLREEAPGTFNHSLVVANLAESCAIAVGEDPFLARVSAYYHDVGKLKNPIMFIENQDGTYNPHDELIPEVSALMITRHARAGYEILKEYHMPEEIARIALEHHGTSSVMFFYLKAQKITEGKLSMNKYRYDGPKPTTKIAAIIMICDTVEAAVRSRLPKTEDELRSFVKKMIKDKMDIGQFDDCDLTFNDLKIIEDDIVKTIPKIYHKRIDYSKEKK